MIPISGALSASSNCACTSRLHDQRLAAEQPEIEREFEDLFTRVSAASMWSSVIDQASFVLPKYAARAAGRRARAARALLARLQTYSRAN